MKRSPYVLLGTVVGLAGVLSFKSTPATIKLTIPTSNTPSTSTPSSNGHTTSFTPTTTKPVTTTTTGSHPATTTTAPATTTTVACTHRSTTPTTIAGPSGVSGPSGISGASGPSGETGFGPSGEQDHAVLGHISCSGTGSKVHHPTTTTKPVTTTTVHHPVTTTTVHRPTTTTTTKPVTTTTTGTRSATGAVVNYNWGTVSVKVTATGKTITGISIASLNDFGNPRSQYIDGQALPILVNEALAAKGANIATVSGASYTSAGFVASLQNALSQLGI